jgi:hypothetical protein
MTELAAHLDVPTYRVRKWIARGHLPAHRRKRSRGQIVVDTHGLEQIMRGGTAGAENRTA